MPRKPAATEEVVSAPDYGATPEQVSTPAYGWAKGDPPPEPPRPDSAVVEFARVDGVDYYRIVKKFGADFVYDSKW